ncbi:MAG: hypothetical protein KGL63_00945 [Betaproteobacteria bacterium]|nr:hypothetical protein [Betaproteobacteria bacterium]
MAANPKPQLLSLNSLQRPELCRALTQEQLHPNSPAAIKKNLELGELDRLLFPTLVTGVRWWPYLSLAMDCESEADKKNVFVVTRHLKKNLGLKKTARMGPETSASLRPYLSMARNLKEDSDSKELCRFLQCKFKGDSSFFTNYRREERWKILLAKANGKPARGYIRACCAMKKEFGTNLQPDQVVTHILRQPSNQYDPVLWRGCFSFAFIRCLFGIYDMGERKAFNHALVMEWKTLLLEILRNPPEGFPERARNSAYQVLLEKIEDEDAPPPLADQTIKFRAEDRPILASLRIPLFHRLYFSPTPSRLIAGNA